MRAERSAKIHENPSQSVQGRSLNHRRRRGSVAIIHVVKCEDINFNRPQVQQMPPWQMQFAFGGPFGMMTSLFGFHAHVGHFPMAYRTDGYGFMGGQNHNGQREEPDAQTALAHALLLLGLLLLLLVAVL